MHGRNLPHVFSVTAAHRLRSSLTTSWHDATSLALELGCELFFEAPPEHVLNDLVHDNLDRMQAWPVTPGDFERLLKLAH
ncbi:MAG TPA: hypothetical protein VN901_24755 [Candidatus Acidoferrales bacterium]|nr:hypothetical protein [Candidatus Acidoferrales bacterium]